MFHLTNLGLLEGGQAVLPKEHPQEQRKRNCSYLEPLGDSQLGQLRAAMWSRVSLKDEWTPKSI